ncbi:MAG TPA: hypothetical protein VN380_11610 [Thermoanaerobaculia bacterium]|jgi:hypothetical protein|nr:hypothetical protein [Thermoanaerobaculia bacterium]
MSLSLRPAKFGPYHRRSHHNPEENELISASSRIWGKPRGNYFAGIVPCVKAWEGPLPEGIIGIEFYTDVEPDPWSVPGWPEWSHGRAGVVILERNELVAIPVIVTMRRDVE